MNNKVNNNLDKESKLTNKDEIFQFFIPSSYSLQNLITKISILSDNENITCFGSLF